MSNNTFHSYGTHFEKHVFLVLIAYKFLYYISYLYILIMIKAKLLIKNIRISINAIVD